MQQRRITDVPTEISDRGQARPTAASSIETMARVVGRVQAERIWANACAAVDLDPGQPDLSVDELKQVAQHLARSSGVVGVLGVSINILIETWRIRQRVRPPKLETR